MRRKLLFYSLAGFFIFSAVAEPALGEEFTRKDHMLSEIPASGNSAADKTSKNTNWITIFMCGDVMSGRGIDQVLPHPSDPIIYESYMKSARGYVKIAEKVNCPIDYPRKLSELMATICSRCRISKIFIGDCIIGMHNPLKIYKIVGAGYKLIITIICTLHQHI
jgi:hypothetical protein